MPIFPWFTPKPTAQRVVAIEKYLNENPIDGEGSIIIVDPIPIDGSVNPVSSNGVFDKLAEKSPTLTTEIEGALINSATPKVTPVDADQIGLVDSSASNVLKKISWANLKTSFLNTIKSSEDSVLAAQKVAVWGDSLTDGYAFPLSLISEYFVYNGGVPGETSTQVKTRMVADTAKANQNVVIWVGRNNYNQLSIVMADIAAMVAALGHNRYIILSVPNGSTAGEQLGGNDYQKFIDLNNAMASTYGAHYFDIRAWLISSGLAAAGITPTGQDITDIANDIVPSSLRSDAIHPTATGYNIIAAKIKTLFAELRLESTNYLRINDLAYAINAMFGLSARFRNAVNDILAIKIAPTVTAFANNDMLAGVDIDPVFNANGKTGTKNVSLRLKVLNFRAVGNVLSFTDNNTGLLYVDTGELSFLAPATTARIGFKLTTTEYGRFYGTTGNFAVQAGGTWTDKKASIQARSFSSAIVAKTAAYTATVSDHTITGDASGGTFNITIPTAVGCEGFEYIIKNVGATNTVTVATTSSQTIDGSTTYPLASQWKYVVIKSNNLNWIVIGNN